MTYLPIAGSKHVVCWETLQTGGSSVTSYARCFVYTVYIIFYFSQHHKYIGRYGANSVSIGMMVPTISKDVNGLTYRICNKLK